ncbi:hypothetical protein [Sinobaca sp. H24]|uniref:hypothetical protein n=1 Tax=Sinobaca sp. H24 TaxID=2923376 RepID=UPI00207A4656|nr:hypothetical protein [Sinobaca sp. H24]
MGRAYNEAVTFLSLLKKHDITGWLVGGCVRDWVKNGRDYMPRDLDITVNASAEEIKRIFNRAHRMSNRHETAVLRHRGHVYELTALKGAGISEDLAARDFTCNAMAVDVNGNLLDPYDGSEAVHSGFIKAVDPSRCFREDPLRILRALRFVSQFGWSMDSRTEAACIKEIEELRGTAVERIKDECSLLLQGSFAERALRMADTFRLFEHLPEPVQAGPLCLWRYQVNKLDDGLMRWAGLFLILYGGKGSSVLGSWSFSNKWKKELGHLLEAVKNHDYKQDSYTLFRAGREQAVRGYLLHQWKYDYTPSEKELKSFYARLDALPIKTKKDLALDGKDILRYFPNLPSAHYGHLLSVLEKKVVTGEIDNKKEQLLGEAAVFVKERGKESDA